MGAAGPSIACGGVRRYQVCVSDFSLMEQRVAHGLVLSNSEPSGSAHLESVPGRKFFSAVSSQRRWGQFRHCVAYGAERIRFDFYWDNPRLYPLAETLVSQRKSVDV